MYFHSEHNHTKKEAVRWNLPGNRKQKEKGLSEVESTFQNITTNKEPERQQGDGLGKKKKNNTPNQKQQQNQTTKPAATSNTTTNITNNNHMIHFPQCSVKDCIWNNPKQ